MFEQELNSYWKIVVDTIQDGIMIVDEGGTIVSVNKALEKITGEDMGYRGYEPETKRIEAIKRWEAWVEEQNLVVTHEELPEEE